MDDSFEKMNAGDLDNVLESFFLEVRSGKGEMYKKTSMIALRHGICRHLMNVGTEFDIVNDPQFEKSSLAFKSMLAKLKDEGKGSIDHHPPLEAGDLTKLYSYLEEDVESPLRLQEKVFVDIMLHFGRRGRENIRDLKIADFWLTRDAEGSRYIYMKYDEKTKNHQNDPNTAKGEMHEKPDSPRCPIRSFVKYKRLLNPASPFLFQRVNMNSKNVQNFNNIPMGHNKLGSMMPSLSRKAGLSIIYTNHSLRATSVHVLDEAQIPSRHIMSVTGHKAETSLRTYTGYTDHNTKKRMSHTISDACQKKPCGEDSSHALETIDQADLDDWLHFPDPEFDNIIGNMSNADLISKVVPNNTNTSANRSSVNEFHSQSQYLGFPTMPTITGDHAVVNINYNIYQK